MLIADIAEKFDNLRRINMKLNQKNARLGWRKESSSDTCSPLKESGPIQKNKDEYRWTESAEKAFQEMKQCIMGLPFLTTPVKEEMLYVYLAAAMEAMSAVLLTERKGKQCLIHYVSRPLNKAERNYAPMEKLALSLLHMSQRLRSYFEAHPHQGHNRSAAEADIEQGPSIRETRQILGGFGSVDSKLVASQINGSYVASSTSMIKYLSTTKECIAGFRSFIIQNIPINLNQKADILSKLVTHAFDHLTKKVLVEVFAKRSTDRKEISAVVEEEEDDWMTPIIRCLAEGVWLEDEEERRALRMKIN
ncbi:reverse transcriptase domain-containing protein, partial [Tanacetum coccineum]